MPQLALPQIFSDDRWKDHLKSRNKAYEKRAEMLVDILGGVEGLQVVKPNGAYYASVVFDDNVLTDEQTLPIENTEALDVITPLLQDAPLDKRFTYFLLAAEGICVVPLSSGFHSQYQGFRITLLEPDEDKFLRMLERISSVVCEYLSS